MTVVNKLGIFDFVELNMGGKDAQPESVEETTEIIQRPGVEGSGIRVAGIKGRPFTMTSGVDVYDPADPNTPAAHLDVAVQLFHDLQSGYKSIVGGFPQTLIWREKDFDDVGVRFTVLSCKLVETFPIVNCVGGTIGAQSFAAYLRAQWQLLAVRF